MHSPHLASAARRNRASSHRGCADCAPVTALFEACSVPILPNGPGVVRSHVSPSLLPWAKSRSPDRHATARHTTRNTGSAESRQPAHAPAFRPERASARVAADDRFQVRAAARRASQRCRPVQKSSFVNESQGARSLSEATALARPRRWVLPNVQPKVTATWRHPPPRASRRATVAQTPSGTRTAIVWAGVPGSTRRPARVRSGRCFACTCPHRGGYFPPLPLPFLWLTFFSL